MPKTDDVLSVQVNNNGAWQDVRNMYRKTANGWEVVGEAWTLNGSEYLRFWEDTGNDPDGDRSFTMVAEDGTPFASIYAGYNTGDPQRNFGTLTPINGVDNTFRGQEVITVVTDTSNDVFLNIEGDLPIDFCSRLIISDGMGEIFNETTANADTYLVLYNVWNVPERTEWIWENTGISFNDGESYTVEIIR